MAEDLLEIVPTRAMLKNGIMPTEFKATVFQERSLANTTPKENAKMVPLNVENKFVSHSKRKRTDDTEFDMKRARHEVIRFGSSGFETKDKKLAQIALAVKLGAKPPKAEYKNYKELLAAKKRQEDVKESARKMLQLGKNRVGAASVRCQPKKLLRRKNKNVGDISQHYGVTKPKLFKSKRRK